MPETNFSIKLVNMQKHCIVRLFLFSVFFLFLVFWPVHFFCVFFVSGFLACLFYFFLLFLVLFF